LVNIGNLDVVRHCVERLDGAASRPVRSTGGAAALGRGGKDSCGLGGLERTDEVAAGTPGRSTDAAGGEVRVTQPDSADGSTEVAGPGFLPDPADESGASPGVPLRIDIPHSARMYDYYLGGKTNYPADRVAAEQILSVSPSARITAEQNRAFLHRAVRFLAGQAGIDQFLDIGTGIPTPPNLHEVAQAIRPTAQVVYVDNDPIVLAHARALLASSPEGRTAYLEADFRRPADILTNPAFTETLDPSRPIALSLLGLLQFFPDAAHPDTILRTLVDVLPAGSYLMLSHGTGDLLPEASKRASDVYNERGIPLQLRSRAEIEALVPADLKIIDPSVVLLHHWRPDPDTEPCADADVSGYCLVAHKL
jgi:hypothetical protein